MTFEAREKQLLDTAASQRRRDDRRLRQLVVILAVCQVLLAGFVWLSGYAGRTDLRDDSVRGCLRSTADRTAQAWGWRQAQAARARGDAADRQTAHSYGQLADGLERRAGLPTPVDATRGLGELEERTLAVRTAFCVSVFPAPSILPFG